MAGPPEPAVSSSTLFRYRVEPVDVEHHGRVYEVVAIEVEVGGAGVEVWGEARRVDDGRARWRSLQLADSLTRPYREDAERRYAEGAR